jgi:hypothetical protein
MPSAKFCQIRMCRLPRSRSAAVPLHVNVDTKSAPVTTPASSPQGQEEPCEGNVTVRVSPRADKLICPFDCSSTLSRDNVCSMPPGAPQTNSSQDATKTLAAAVCTCGPGYAGRFCNSRKEPLRGSEWKGGAVDESGRLCYFTNVGAEVAGNASISVEFEVRAEYSLGGSSCRRLSRLPPSKHTSSLNSAGLLGIL